MRKSAFFILAFLTLFQFAKGQDNTPGAAASGNVSSRRAEIAFRGATGQQDYYTQSSLLALLRERGMEPFGLRAVSPASVGIVNPFSSYGREYYSSYWLQVSPFGGAYNAFIGTGNTEAAESAGSPSKRISGVVDMYFSSAYMGYMHPVRVNSPSVRGAVNVQLNDRVSVMAFGRYSPGSVRDRRYIPVMGGPNYFGVSAQAAVNDWLNVEGGVVRSSYNGFQSTSYFVAPVIKVGEASFSIGVSATQSDYPTPVVGRGR